LSENVEEVECDEGGTSFDMSEAFLRCGTDFLGIASGQVHWGKPRQGMINGMLQNIDHAKRTSNCPVTQRWQLGFPSSHCREA
jgi:hypothetical protein